MKSVGYQRRGDVSHRKYDWRASRRHFKRTGTFKHVASGSGHRAGEAWGEAKQIDPYSRVRKYSKNSPSFDEGVYQYKTKRRQIAERMAQAFGAKGAKEVVLHEE